MDITFDLNNDKGNQEKHGVSLSDAAMFDWGSALVWEDKRRTYGERRECALGLIDDRVYCIVYVVRDGKRRIISLRKANLREATRYVSET